MHMHMSGLTNRQSHIEQTQELTNDNMSGKGMSCKPGNKIATANKAASTGNHPLQTDKREETETANKKQTNKQTNKQEKK